jgi:hypothetical protein
MVFKIFLSAILVTGWGCTGKNRTESNSAASDSPSAANDPKNPTEEGEGITGYVTKIDETLATGERHIRDEDYELFLPAGIAEDLAGLAITIEPLERMEGLSSVLIGQGKRISIGESEDSLTFDEHYKMVLTIPYTDSTNLQEIVVAITDEHTGAKEIIPNAGLSITIGADITSVTVAFLTNHTKASFGIIDSSDVSSEFKTIAVPDNPTIISAIAKDKAVTLTWQVSEGLEGLVFAIVYDQGLTPPDDCYVGDVAGYTQMSGQTSMTVANLKNGLFYSFRVCAKANTTSLPSSGNFISIATLGIPEHLGGQKFQLKSAQLLPSSVTAGANIASQDIITIHLVNSQGQKVPGSGLEDVFLKAYTDPQCTIPSTSTNGGKWQVVLKNGEAHFWNLNHHRSETIFLAACDSGDCESGSLQHPKTCIDSPISVLASTATNMAITSELTVTAGEPISLTIEFQDMFANSANFSGKVSIKACNEQSSDSECQSTGIQLLGLESKSVMGTSVSFGIEDNLIYPSYDRIRLHVATKTLNYITEVIQVGKAKGPRANPELQATLVPDHVANAHVVGDLFGLAMDMDGEWLAIAAPGQDYNATGDGGPGPAITNTGAVYMFRRSGNQWLSTQKVQSDPWFMGSFGGENNITNPNWKTKTLALNGNNLVVGAMRYEVPGGQANDGVVYSYDYDGTSWVETQKIVPNGTNVFYFGKAVAASADFLAVGVPEDDYDLQDTADIGTKMGAIYLYSRVDGMWVDQQKVVSAGPNGRTDNERFGEHIAITGQWLAVGVPDYTGGGAVFMYQYTGGTWSFRQLLIEEGTATTNEKFGASVALHNNTLAVGIPNFDDGTVDGGVAVFTFDGNSWSQQGQVVTPSDNTGVSYYGDSVDIYNDSLIIGSINFTAGAVGCALFSRASGQWSESALLPFNAETVVIDGDTLVTANYSDWNSSTSSLVDAGTVKVWK